ncbi:MAG: hypothetical protein Kow0089_08730 [Desulfobulbaceae bacterium]
MLYFAYGSNLSTPRLRARVPSAEKIAVCGLERHCLVFHKVGRDGSAKCDAFFTGREEDVVHGVLYRINPEEKPRLDRAEGLGKGYLTKKVRLAEGSTFHTGFLYYATLIDPGLKPFHWYREHVLFGAREHGLPEASIRTIEAVDVITDPDRERTARELGIYSDHSLLATEENRP